MPRFHIDTYDGLVCLDEDGHELPGREAARRLALRALSEMMRSEIERLTPVELRAVVRDAHGRSVIVATLRVDVAETD